MSKPPIISAIVYKSSGKFLCSICERVFSQRSNALTHYKNVHINVRKNCPYCDACVKKLQYHIRDVHSSKKKVQCEVCGKPYKEGRLLKDHLNKVHCLDFEGNSLVRFSKRVPCRICQQEVANIRLARHLKEKHYLAASLYDCPLCDSRVKFLHWHLRNYHKYKEKLFKCYRCENLFLSKLDLNEHLVSHEEYHCQDCDESFIKFLEFSAHLDTVHNKFGQSSDPNLVNQVKPEIADTSHLITKYYFSKENTNGPEIIEEEFDELQVVCEETMTISVDGSGKIIDESDQREVKTDVESNNAEARQLAGPRVEVAELEGEKLFDIIIPPSDMAKPIQSQRLTERFRKEDVPRDLRNVTLSEEDEELLRSCPGPDQLGLMELARYQIQSKAVTKNKYEACPSRQAHLCPYCRQVLRTRNSLSSHIAVVHKKQKNVTCHLCGKGCATKAELTKHNLAVHDQTRGELVVCQDCGEHVRKCYLNRHRSYKHSKNNKTKICDKCGKDFKSRETMLKHVRKIHS